MGRLGTFYYFRNGLLFRWRWARSSLPGSVWTRLFRPLHPERCGGLRDTRSPGHALAWPRR